MVGFGEYPIEGPPSHRSRTGRVSLKNPPLRTFLVSYFLLFFIYVDFIRNIISEPLQDLHVPGWKMVEWLAQPCLYRRGHTWPAWGLSHDCGRSYRYHASQNVLVSLASTKIKCEQSPALNTCWMLWSFLDVDGGQPCHLLSNMGTATSVLECSKQYPYLPEVNCNASSVEFGNFPSNPAITGVGVSFCLAKFCHESWADIFLPTRLTYHSS